MSPRSCELAEWPDRTVCGTRPDTWDVDRFPPPQHAGPQRPHQGPLAPLAQQASAPHPEEGWGAEALRSCNSAGAGAPGLVGALGLEVRDGGLDLGLVLGLAGLLDHLGGDPGCDELLEHSHARLLVVGCLSDARTNECPTTSPVADRASEKRQ